jgi:Fe-Mn family superoxide dismutase
MIADRYFWISVCPRTWLDAPIMLAGASMHAPVALARWIEEIPRDRPVVVYCICGFQVSGKAVTELRQRGYDARALVGGITAWHAIGGATVPLDTFTYERAT